MITQPSYYNRLREAVDTGSTVAVKSALDEIRAHYAAFKLQQEGTALTGPTAGMSTAPLVDVRNEDDFTILMYACAKYRLFKQQGNAQDCLAMDTVVAWLIEQGACTMAQGGRAIIRVANAGRYTFKRGQGKNVIEALGYDFLPPTIQRAIEANNDAVGDAEYSYQYRRDTGKLVAAAA